MIRPSLSPSSVLFSLLLLASTACALLQGVIEADYVNVVASALIWLSTTTTVVYLWRSQVFDSNPLAALAVLGLCFTSQAGALLVQTASWTPLAENLYDPIHTFGWLAVFQLTALGALITFRSLAFFGVARAGIQRTFLAPLGVFRIPVPRELWVLGVLGLLAGLLSRALGGGLLSKLLDSLRFLSWAPFLIPVLPLWVPAYPPMTRGKWAAMWWFVAAVVFAAMTTGARTAMLAGVVTGGLLFLLALLREHRPAGAGFVWKLSGGLLAGALLLQPLEDVALAMVVARDLRDTIAPHEVVKETLTVLVSERYKLDAYRESFKSASTQARYDENYIFNPVLARLVETKFHDNMLYFVQGLSEDETRELRRITGDLILAALPQPILDWLKLDIQKAQIQASMGDYIVNLRLGHELFGHKVGSVFAHGLALFGNSFVLIYFGMCLVSFLLWESLVLKSDGSVGVPAPVAMLLLWPLFLAGIVGESLIKLAHDVIRTSAQNLFVYCLAAWAAHRLLGPRKT
jgi:hypothetical protein